VDNFCRSDSDRGWRDKALKVANEGRIKANQALQKGQSKRYDKKQHEAYLRIRERINIIMVDGREGNRTERAACCAIPEQV